MTDFDTIGAWLGGLAATVLAALGIRLQWSKVNRKVSEEDAEAAHSSGLIATIDYWRRKSELDSKRAIDAELIAADLRADLKHLTVIREERDQYKQIAESQSKISQDLSRLADLRGSQLEHEQSNTKLKLRLLRKQCPQVDLSIFDSTPAPLDES